MIDRLALGALRALPAERAHRVALTLLRLGLAGAGPAPAAPADALRQTVFGLRFDSPVGVAAGFDKNAEAVDATLRLGAGFVEVGAVTPQPQFGNPRPRLFRLADDAAVINRMGFNNEGLAAARARLAARRSEDRAQLGPVGVNIGANKDAADRAADYETTLRGLYGLADFFVVNVSSPNTEGLRALQAGAALKALLGRMIAARDALAGESGARAPLLVKIAPDLEPDQLKAAADAMTAAGVDGAVATNTTLARPASLASPHAAQAGGLSGQPLFEQSTEILRALRRETGGALPLIGVGGVATGAQAYAKIRSGASLVQLYTALVFAGPRLLVEIRDDLARRLWRDGFAHIAEAVGVDA